MTTAMEIARHLDELLLVREIPDYPPALNGLQLESRGDVTRVAAAVDFSLRTIDGAIAAGANLLLVHHGMFWGGMQRITGRSYDRLQRLIANDVAVYAAHLPLDAHPQLGNNALLARELGLEPTGTFARYQTVDVGVRGEATVPTTTIVERARTLARRHGGDVVATPHAPDRVTRRWAICTGAGASSESLRDALALGVDTLVVGEGPHHTAVEAADQGLVVVYAGHYATETLGVIALARHLEETFGLPWTFVEAPTGL
jgi:dinuclear metal center YbgI/SA1388 family protein